MRLEQRVSRRTFTRETLIFFASLGLGGLSIGYLSEQIFNGLENQDQGITKEEIYAAETALIKATDTARMQPGVYERDLAEMPASAINTSIKILVAGISYGSGTMVGVIPDKKIGIGFSAGHVCRAIAQGGADYIIVSQPHLGHDRSIAIPSVNTAAVFSDSPDFGIFGFHYDNLPYIPQGLDEKSIVPGWKAPEGAELYGLGFPERTIQHDSYPMSIVTTSPPGGSVTPYIYSNNAFGEGASGTGFYYNGLLVGSGVKAEYYIGPEDNYSSAKIGMLIAPIPDSYGSLINEVVSKLMT